MSKQGQEERKELRFTDYYEQLAEVFNIQVTTDTKDIQPQQFCLSCWINLNQSLGTNFHRSASTAGVSKLEDATQGRGS